MAVYYYQGMPILAPFTITSNEPFFDVETISLKRQRVSQGYQRWELSFNVQPDKTQPQDLLVDMLVNDQAGATTMIMPQFKEVSDTSTATGSASVAVAGVVGDSSVSLTTSSASGTLPKGSFISFNNHDKVYILTADMDMSGATATANIYPNLKFAMPITTTTLEFGDSCLLTYYRDINTLTSIQFTDGILASPGLINLFEAV